jgi:hypothetical protein
MAPRFTFFGGAELLCGAPLRSNELGLAGCERFMPVLSHDERNGLGRPPRSFHGMRLTAHGLRLTANGVRSSVNDGRRFSYCPLDVFGLPLVVTLVC